MRLLLKIAAPLLCSLAFASALPAAASALPAAASAKSCSAYSNQAAAQRAADTRDGDRDGIYCESLPCPCLKNGVKQPASKPAPNSEAGKPAPNSEAGKPAPNSEASKPAPNSEASKPAPNSEAGCQRPSGVQNIGFSATKYRNIRRHFLEALGNGWPATLVLKRSGASERRDRLLTGVSTRKGYDRDEYPPAVGRGVGAGLMRGVNPVGWMASVMLIPSGENRSHGAVMGAKLRGLCSGTKFRYLFY